MNSTLVPTAIKKTSSRTRSSGRSPKLSPPPPPPGMGGLSLPKRLAIKGGVKATPDGAIKPWPPIDAIDREMVLASLNGGSHAFGPNCDAFQKEFAEWNGNQHAITTNS